GLNLRRDDLVLEPAGLLRSLGLLLRSGGELVLLLARDLPFLGDVLGGVAHVIAVEGIPQAVLDHGVDHLRVAHLGAVAQMHAVRRLAHAFLAAGDDDLAVAELDRLRTQRHRAQARAAELVDGIGRLLDRAAGGDGRLAGRVLAGSGGEDLAEDDLAHLARLNLGALQRFGDGDLSEVGSGHAAQGSAERADRRPRRADDYDFGHRFTP